MKREPKPELDIVSNAGQRQEAASLTPAITFVGHVPNQKFLEWKNY